MDLETITAQREEHEAWLAVVAEWNHLHPQPGGFSFNGKICNSFVKAVEAWGERLVSLRVQQTEDERATALNEKSAAYAEAKKK